MSRPARIRGSTGIYHVTQRGINRQAIFADDEDCRVFLGILSKCRAVSGFELYAYCLMGNHFHLLLKQNDEPIEVALKRIGVRYVKWFNKKYNRTGPLFQNRYHSKPVEDERYFITALRYVYQNPVKAGLCARPAEYRWSSFRLLGTSDELVSQDEIFEIIPLPDLQALTHEPIAATDPVLLEIAGTRPDDGQAIELIKATTGLEDPRQLCELQKSQLYNCVLALREAGCTVRQIEQLTGVSSAIIYHIKK